MSVTNKTLRSPAIGGYECDGSTTAFAGTFNLLAEGDLKVILTDVNGTESPLTLTTDYTVAPTGGSYPCTAFTVTTVSTYASGNTITLIRSMDLTQPTTYGNAGPYYPSIHETSYDRLLLQLQQQQEILDRCVKDAASATATTDPTSYLAACQAAQAAAEAAETGATNANTNLYAVDFISTSNVDIANDLEAGDSLDSATINLGDRILLVGQAVPGEDGIYVAQASGAAVRASDYPVGTRFSGHVYAVSRGTTKAGKVYVATNGVLSDTIGTNTIIEREVVTANTADDKHWVRRSGVMAEESITSAGAALLDDASASAQRTTLGLGTMATQAANAVAITGGVADTDVFILEHSAADGVAGGASSATTWNKRTLVSVDNGISGASVASSVITLPAGTYKVRSWQKGCNNLGVVQARLYNTTDTSNAIIGASDSSGGTGDTITVQCDGRFTIADTKNFELQMYTNSAIATNGLGLPSSTGIGERYAYIEIEKIA